VTDDRVSRTAGDASRRTVMSGIVGVGVGVPILAACGAEDSESPEGGSGGDAGGDTGGDTGGDSGGSGAAASGAIGKTSEVPVGGAKIFKGKKVMVSQPSEGEFKAFSTICTHEKCPIFKVDGDEIECNCHFSRFAIADGSVAKGPATEPLKELKVTVEGDDLIVS
jgi:nitrite reductase/ring-hydroxylating ferredoxin subunit